MTEPAAIRGQGYLLVKNWDFGVNIRTDKVLRQEFYTRFAFNGGASDHFNDEWQRYRDNNNHVLQGKDLAIASHAPGRLESGGFDSGMLRSKWVGQYGYFEVRMKVPSARGVWPAFWLMPEDLVTPPELDVVEIVNNGRDTTRKSFHFLHGSEIAQTTYSLLDESGGYIPGFDYADAFHTFAVEWTPEEVRHYVDDRLVVSRKFNWVHPDGANAGPASVIVNLAIGGKWPEAPVSLSDFPVALNVEYVRVWQKK